jgi:phage baseplate assembly protein gpV
MRLAYKHFRGTFISWEALFQQAADFASSLGPKRVRSVSHSSDHSEGIVTVWYAEDVPAPASSRDRLRYQFHRGTLASWETLFDQAAETSTRVGADSVLAVTHSADHSDGVVTVWYWE